MVTERRTPGFQLPVGSFILIGALVGLAAGILLLDNGILGLPVGIVFGIALEGRRLSDLILRGFRGRRTPPRRGGSS